MSAQRPKRPQAVRALPEPSDPEIMSRLAVAGINLRGLSLSCLSNRFAAYLAFDSADIATQATQILATLA